MPPRCNDRRGDHVVRTVWKFQHHRPSCWPSAAAGISQKSAEMEVFNCLSSELLTLELVHCSCSSSSPAQTVPLAPPTPAARHASTFSPSRDVCVLVIGCKLRVPCQACRIITFILVQYRSRALCRAASNGVDYQAPSGIIVGEVPHAVAVMARGV